MDEKSPTKLCLRFSLSPDQLKILEGFMGNHSEDKMFGAHEVLTQGLQDACTLESADLSVGSLWLEERLGVTVEKVVQVGIMDHFCIALFFIRNELTALGRVVGFEACCQWALLSEQITRPVTLTLLFNLLYRSTFILLSAKCMWVFSCFCNPLNSDMDYRILITRK